MQGPAAGDAPRAAGLRAGRGPTGASVHDARDRAHHVGVQNLSGVHSKLFVRTPFPEETSMRSCRAMQHQRTHAMGRISNDATLPLTLATVHGCCEAPSSASRLGTRLAAKHSQCMLGCVTVLYCTGTPHFANQMCWHRVDAIKSFFWFAVASGLQA